MPGNLWIDVEDLFEYARNHARPSGIQRLAFEIYHALYVRDDGAGHVHFVRHAPMSNSFRVVSWAELAALFANLTDGAIAPPMLVSAPAPRGQGRQVARLLAHRLPTSLRPIVIDVLLTSVAALQAWGRLAVALVNGVLRTPLRWRRARDARNADLPLPAGLETVNGQAPPARVNFSAMVAPGDAILVLGAPWSHPDYAGLIHAMREKHDVRFALLVYDLIPLRRPEWFDGGLVPLFRTWFDTMLPLCDHVFAISNFTAKDVEIFAAERGITLREHVLPIPIGTGLNVTLPRIEENGASRHPERDLPVPGSYALIVSTIEIRKNHLLLFRVWRRLLEELPHDRVPTLVFAGRVGWLVEDLMLQIRNTSSLNGKLIVVESPSDAELSSLYQGCLFTLFPSFYEGWGLPVTESLALGKPCITSNRTALPEAGANLTRSFDPDNLHEAYAVIRAVIEDRPGLARWEDQVRREFQTVPWSATVDALLSGLQISAADSRADIVQETVGAEAS